MSQQYHAAGKKWKTILGKINRNIICKTHGLMLAYASVVGSRLLSCGHHQPKKLCTEWKKTPSKTGTRMRRGLGKVVIRKG